jgi:hypothetical protein
MMVGTDKPWRKLREGTTGERDAFYGRLIEGFNNPGGSNMTKTFAAVAISAALIVPALAQDTWYVVQDTTTKRCSVVKERPTVKTTVIVSPSGSVYKTEEEATTGMRDEIGFNAASYKNPGDYPRGSYGRAYASMM